MCCCKHKCFITLETLTNAANVTLPDNSRIRDGKITSILLRRADGGTLKSPLGRTLAADTVIATAHATFRNKNGLAITDPVPLSMLQRDYNSPEPLAVSWTDVDPTQTTIVIDTGAAGYNAAHVIEIVFGLDCDQCGY